MTDLINAGGPAFPITRVETVQKWAGLTGPAEVTYFGMTLRDWFAGQALSGMNLHRNAPDVTAASAYRIADAMLEARK